MDVERYFKKAYLSLPEDEYERKIQIDKINKIVDKVESIMQKDTSDYKEFEITSDLKSPLREDEVKDSTDRELIFANTNHREYGYFKLDNIMED
ncbi:Asp-tRNA(Asn)/Glu-tRNA(Gln) amidotransferase subunit GatC [Helcococcus kunzii]|uniref:Asp-tRNA(Asn)/Glu-tRNA(Gln) amidotransferase subunit GatC n=1 Tax=Helcococcus kunzii TaxID=40091 RepID=UPI0024ACE8A3|nr:aspartyl/glutamyl-tRNA amidotransferase subunit C [Helcococcus kunzii]